MWTLLPAAVFTFVVCPSATAAAAEKGAVQASLRVLIVSSAAPAEYAGGIKQLLEQHNVAVTVQGLPFESPAQEFDLIIIAGTPGQRAVDGLTFPGSDKPVLGYGVYGCAFFGTLQLKNGYPYT